MPSDHAQLAFHALSDPRRRALLDQVARSDGLSVGQLTSGSGVTQGAISQHLKVLRSARLVIGEPRGRNVYYRADPAGVAPVIDWLANYRRFWPERLDRLRSLLAEMDE
jgi:DNA-binding transcriptional ArsR family regulator